MRTDKSFRKSFVCATVLFVLLVLFVTASDGKIPQIALVYFFCLFVLIALLTGIWSFLSKKTWSWGRFAVTVFGFFMVYVVIGDIIRAIAASAARP